MELHIIFIGPKGGSERQLRIGPIAVLGINEEIQYFHWCKPLTSKTIIAWVRASISDLNLH